MRSLHARGVFAMTTLLGLVIACGASAPVASPVKDKPRDAGAPRVEPDVVDSGSVDAASFACVSLPSAAASEASAPRSTAPVLAKLGREACYGRCPVYVLTVHTDGFVEFDGEAWVEHYGRRTKTISKKQVTDLVQAFERARFFNLRDRYTKKNVTDLSSTVVSFAWNGKKKKIEHYHGDPAAPEALTLLEDEIDHIVDVAAWIGHPRRAEPEPCGDCAELNCRERTAHCKEKGKFDDCDAGWRAMRSCLSRTSDGRACHGLPPGASEPVRSYVDCLERCCGSSCVDKTPAREDAGRATP